VEFRLRDFRQDDFETVWRIDQQCFAPGISYSRVDLAAYLRRPLAFALVAEFCGSGKSPMLGKGISPDDSVPAIVGFIVAEPGSRGVGHIITIDVLPAQRGSGIGSSLLQAAEERLRAARCHSVILETAVDNRVALSFYKKHAYSVTKAIPGYYSDGVDALVMKKNLLSRSAPANLPQ